MRVIAAAVLLGLAIALPAAAQLPANRSLAPFTARELAPGIHLLATPPDYLGAAISNVTVIEQRNGYVLIDSGATAGHGRVIAGYVRALGSKPVKAVVFTHWHNDHPLGASEIRKAWPKMRIVSTAATRAVLLSPVVQAAGPRPDDRNDVFVYNQVSASMVTIAMRKADPATTNEQRARYDRMAAELNDFAASYHGTYVVPPTETFTDRLLLDDPERPVELRFLGRANTAGDAIAWLPKQRIVMTGDIVVSPVPFGFYSYPADWLRTIEKLKALDFTLLVPGHGEPQRDADYLDKLAGTIRDIRTQVGTLAAEGLSLEDTRKRVDFSAQSAIFGTTPRLKAGFQSVWLAPMIENAWREAKGLPIVQGGGETTPASVRRDRAQSGDAKTARSR
jgi:glyoxylase-like metal-dependent hydrolase (beta-lactamase superfamily II)